jgi:hypothetical protein
MKKVAKPESKLPKRLAVIVDGKILHVTPKQFLGLLR